MPFGKDPVVSDGGVQHLMTSPLWEGSHLQTTYKFGSRLRLSDLKERIQMKHRADDLTAAEQRDLSIMEAVFLNETR